MQLQQSSLVGRGDRDVELGGVKGMTGGTVVRGGRLGWGGWVGRALWEGGWGGR